MARKQNKPLLPLDLVIDEYERDLRRHDFQPSTIAGYHKVLKQVHEVFARLLERNPTLDLPFRSLQREKKGKRKPGESRENSKGKEKDRET